MSSDDKDDDLTTIFFKNSNDLKYVKIISNTHFYEMFLHKDIKC